MSRARRMGQRIGGFSASVILTGATGLLTIPIVVASAGSEAWASIAVGQAIGVIATVLVGLGFAQLGPTVLARATRSDRAQYYWDSAVLRVLAYVTVIPFVLFASLVLTPDDGPTTVVAALGATAIALSAPWYFIGAADPKAMLLFDAVPRAVGMWAGALATAVTRDGLTMAIAILCGSIASASVSFAVIRHRDGAPATRGLTQLGGVVKGQLSGIGIGFFSTVYQSMPLLLVSAILPGATASYALGDRIRQQAATAVAPIAQAAQGWVPRASRGGLIGRVRSVRNAALALAVLSTTLFILLAPPISQFLGAGVVSVGLDLSVPLGVTFGLSVATLLIGSACLLPLDRAGAVARSALAGTVAIAVALCMVVLAPSASAVAIATSFAQAAVLISQLWSLRRAMREGGHVDDSVNH